MLGACTTNLSNLFLPASFSSIVLCSHAALEKVTGVFHLLHLCIFITLQQCYECFYINSRCNYYVSCKNVACSDEPTANYHSTLVLACFSSLFWLHCPELCCFLFILTSLIDLVSSHSSHSSDKPACPAASSTLTKLTTTCAYELRKM